MFANCEQDLNGRRWGFDDLPKEIKQLIFSFTDLDLATVLRLQSVSSEFKKLCWTWMRHFDTSLLADKERTPTVAAYFITRANPTRIRSLNLSKYDNPLGSATILAKKFPNLESIEPGYRDEDELPIFELLEFAASHPTLSEISLTTMQYAGCLWMDEEVRCVLTVHSTDNSFYLYLLPTPGPFNAFSIAQPFIQQRPICYNRSYHRGGTIGEEMIVIGAKDGTLTFLTLDAVNSTLSIHSTITDAHEKSINAIWSESPTHTLIGSADGKVTRWSCVDDKPILEHTYQFPESILFVSDHSEKYLLAAGKRTLYIAEIETTNIVRQIGFDKDITGLFKFVLATDDGIYKISDDVISNEQLPFSERNCPNLWVSPDKEASLGISVEDQKVQVFNMATNEDLYYFSTQETYDTRPHLARFSGWRYWLTVSNGPSILTVDLESKKSVASVSPRLSRKEMKEGMPNCNALWYSRCGRFLFGLYSNNALYWWHMPNAQRW